MGVVDKFENGELLVSYMKRADQKGLTWLFPDEAEIHLTKRDQVIARSIPVRYSVTAKMRCILNVKAHTIITQWFKNSVGYLMLLILGMNSHTQISQTSNVSRLFLSKFLHQSRCCVHLYVFHWPRVRVRESLMRRIKNDCSMFN